VEKIETEEIKEAVSAEIIKKTGEEEAIRLIGDIAGPIIDKLTVKWSGLVRQSEG
jgi:hypothetical protein